MHEMEGKALEDGGLQWRPVILGGEKESTVVAELRQVKDGGIEEPAVSESP